MIKEIQKPFIETYILAKEDNRKESNNETSAELDVMTTLRQQLNTPEQQV